MSISVAILLLGRCLTPAEAAEPVDYQGRFSAPAEAVQRETDRVVEAGASQFSAWLRGIARRRLAKSQRSATWVTFAWSGDDLTIGSSIRPEGFTSPVNGETVPTTDDDGKPATVRRWMQDGVLHTQACNADGDCIDRTFRLDGNTLEVTRTTRSSQLSAPITYRMRYTRSDPPPSG